MLAASGAVIDVVKAELMRANQVSWIRGSNLSWRKKRSGPGQSFSLDLLSWVEAIIVRFT